MSGINSSTTSTSQFSNAIPLQTMYNLIKRTGGDSYRWSADAIQLVRDAAETHVTDTFARAQVFAKHGQRKGVNTRDMALARTYDIQAGNQVKRETSI
jgi:histone H3/H4